MHVTDATMPNTILPPPGSQPFTSPAIPIYDDHGSGSLRPTWLPLDPTSYPPPAPKTRGVGLVKVAQLAGLLLLTWGVAFGSVVGSHAAREALARRAAAAAAQPLAIASVVAPKASSEDATVSASTKTVDSGVTLTVDVNDLPVSKDLRGVRGGKGQGAARKRSAGS